MRLALKLLTNQGPKYMYNRNIPKWRLWKLSDPEKYGRGVVNSLKNAYGEQPFVCLCAFVGFIGVVKGTIEWYDNEETGARDFVTYSRFLHVYRPDDPAVTRNADGALKVHGRACAVTSRTDFL
eukprot:TRINITY_DN8081_c0_g1_i10.p1 TRINITY_DN8081_c0_g1~~TRINITY_DN8081_c0_g1_i10.p1  ORF type:complete len:124 (-),score=9.73 TRINITY_DN8081_c0_g1_i10:316-687(-)